MKTIIFLLLLIIGSSNIQNNHTFKSYTLFHESGKLVEKPILVNFLSPEGNIKHDYVHSLSFFELDSISFLDNNPDRQQLHGTTIELNFYPHKDSLHVVPFSPEYYSIFVAHHTIRAIEYYDSLFSGDIDIIDKLKENLAHYLDIEVYLGRYANSSPNQYVFTPGSLPSPTIVYHEVGHLVFWLLQNILPIGEVGYILHMGLLEYFTVSLANHPVVLEGLVPNELLRDASQNLRYPDDILNYAQFMNLYYEAYKDSFEVAPNYKLLYDINQKRMAQWDSLYNRTNVAEDVIEAHKSGMVITHPLWKIRSKIGQKKCDKLVKNAMLLLPSILPMRDDYLDDSVTPPEGRAVWYDLVYAILLSDESLYSGAHNDLISHAFRNTGFNLDVIQMEKL